MAEVIQRANSGSCLSSTRKSIEALYADMQQIADLEGKTVGLALPGKDRSLLSQPQSNKTLGNAKNLAQGIYVLARKVSGRPELRVDGVVVAERDER